MEKQHKSSEIVLTPYKLTRRQRQVIQALLTEPTIEKAAKKVGISRQTVFVWRKQPQFEAAYKQACHHVMDQAFDLLQTACSEAVNTLVNVIQLPDDGVGIIYARVSASRAILDNALKTRLIDEFDCRITALEKAINAGNAR